jgi:hypothetical protein
MRAGNRGKDGTVGNESSITYRFQKSVKCPNPSLSAICKSVKWTGQDLADFISVSTYTGLRTSDVSTFHIDRMQPTGEIHIRTTKAVTHVYTWVPEWLKNRIRERARELGRTFSVNTRRRT